MSTWFIAVKPRHLTQVRQFLKERGVTHTELLAEDLLRCTGPETLSLPASVIVQMVPVPEGESEGTQPVSELASPPVAVNQPVRIVTGPAAGCVGLVTSVTAHRVTVRTLVWGKGLTLTLPREHVEPVSTVPPWDRPVAQDRSSPPAPEPGQSKRRRSRSEPEPVPGRRSQTSGRRRSD